MHEQRRRQIEEETGRDRVPPPLGFAPQTWALVHTHTHTCRPADPGEDKWGQKEGSPPRLQPECGKECFPAHHLVVSPHSARSSGWKCSGARPTRSFQEPPHAPPSGAVHSAASAGRAPRSRASPRALLPGSLRLARPLPFPALSFFFSPSLPPPAVPPSSRWMRAAVDSERAAGLRQRMLSLLT